MGGRRRSADLGRSDPRSDAVNELKADANRRCATPSRAGWTGQTAVMLAVCGSTIVARLEVNFGPKIRRLPLPDPRCAADRG